MLNVSHHSHSLSSLLSFSHSPLRHSPSAANENHRSRPPSSSKRLRFLFPTTATSSRPNSSLQGQQLLHLLLLTAAAAVSASLPSPSSIFDTITTKINYSFTSCSSPTIVSHFFFHCFDFLLLSNCNFNKFMSLVLIFV